MIVSHGKAYINIFGQKLVRCFVFLQHVTVYTSASKRAAEQEAEKTVNEIN